MKSRPVKKKRRKATKPTWVTCGFDISMSCVAGAAFGYDGTLGRYAGPVFVDQRWPRNTHYFTRLEQCARANVFVHDLIAKLLLTPDLHEIFIAVEEPWPMGIFKGKLKPDVSWAKQQAQLTGAFLGGLVRYGYKNVFEINNTTWKKPIADELELPGRTRNPEMKWKVQEWALDSYVGVPDWPPIIDSKKGRVPRPEGSRAKGVQPDDRYDALGIMDWLKTEIEEGRVEVEQARAFKPAVQAP